MSRDQAGQALRFRVLGPLQALKGDRELRLGGEQQRALLALLALRANEVVASDRLIEALFGADASDAGMNRLQVSVSRLRRLLEEDAIETRPRGYLLHVGPGGLDLAAFELLLDDGRRSLDAGDPAAALAAFREALALWRGPPLADLADVDAVQPEIRRLVELRLTAVIERIDAELALGRGAELVPELQTLVAENPLRERLRGQLMLALYRSGRQADALAVYRDTRELLDDELGLEPSRELQELERAILRHDPALDGARVLEPAPEPSVVVCPFKGLAPFVAADTDYFFGRESLVSELVSRLADSTFVGVVGASGSGKSSLLQAGLVPALAAGALPGSSEWRTLVIRPGTHPLAELPPTNDRAGRLVVAVDQLEEVFTACADEGERAAFLERTCDLARSPGRDTLVVVALRVDFYGACAVYPGFASLLSGRHVLVGPMRREELVSAITGPAARTGLEVEPKLVDALVGDVADEPGALPLLSTSLLELWRLRDGRKLQLASYRETGGVHGAVARLAENGFAQLDEDEQRVARGILLRLVTGDETIARRRVPLDELDLDRDEQAARVVSVLTEARLLTAGEDSLELSHEALLTEWPRLRDWLDEDREGRRLHSHLAASAREWASRDRDPGELYRGARLTAALDWTTEHEPELNQVEREFLAAARAENERELAGRRRQVRRLRGLLVGAGLLLVLAVIAGAIALVSRSNAQQSATAAVAQRLGAQALLANDLRLSLLLARQGVSMDKSPATLGNLEAALVRSPAAIRDIQPLPGGLGAKVVTSPDGRYLVVQGSEGVAVLDRDSLRTVRILHNIAFAPTFTTDGQLLVYVTAGPNYGPGVIAPAAGPVRNVYRPKKDEQHGAMSQDRRFYGWSSTRDGRTILTETSLIPAEKVLHRSLLGPGWPVQDIESEQGRLLVFRGANAFNGGPGKVEVWTFDPWRLETVVTSSVGFSSGDVAWNIDRQRRRIVLGHPDGSVTVTDLRTGRTRSMNGRHGGQVLGVGFSPDGRTIVSTGDDAQVLVWNADTGQLREKLSGHFGNVFGPAFSPDGRTLYTVDGSGALIAWDLSGLKRLGRPFRAGGGNGNAYFTFKRFAFSPDGTRLASGENPGRATIVQLATGRDLLQTGLTRGGVNDVAWSPNGRLLATGTDQGYVQTWNPATGKLIRTYIHLPPRGPGGAGGGNTYSIAFSPDGSLLAAGDGNSEVRLWRVDSGRLLWTRHARKRGYAVFHIAFSPKGDKLAAVFDHDPNVGGAFVWRVSDGKPLYRVGSLTGQDNFAVAFSPDGKLLVTGGGGGTIDFWNAQTGVRAGRSLPGNPGWIRSLQFDPTGQLLLAAGQDGLARLFDVTARAPYGAPLPGYTGNDSEAFFSPDGSHVVTIYGDGRAVNWDIRPSSWEQRACAVAGRNLTRDEWTRYLGSRSYQRTCPSLPPGK